MKLKTIIFFVILISISGCYKENERRIKLATKPSMGILFDRVSTIQIAAGEKKKVAVYHFLNKTGKTSLNWLEMGIVEMLSSDLSQSRQLNLTPFTRVAEEINNLGIAHKAINDSPKGLQVAQNLGVDTFICGNYYIQNDSLYISVDLRDGKNGKLVKRIKEQGAGLENVFTMVSRLSKSLRENMQIQIYNANEIDRRQGRVTARSLEAFKNYSLGLDLLYKVYTRDAIKYLGKAIELDTTFASAYYYLAEAYLAFNKTDTARILLDKAVNFTDDLPPRERLVILATKYGLDGDLSKTVELLIQLTDMFPDDADAHAQLGNYYFTRSQLVDKAIEQFEISLSLDPEQKLVWNHLGYCYANIGKLDYAYSALSKYIELAQDEPNPYDSFGEIYQRQGELDKAIEKYKMALKKKPHFIPSMYHLAIAYMDKGDNKMAHKIIKKMLKSPDAKVMEYDILYLQVIVEIAEGKIDNARKSLIHLHERFPTNGQDLYLLSLLDNDKLRNNERLDTWLKQFTTDGEWDKDIAFEKIFNIVALCLMLDHNLKDADTLLIDFLNKTTDPFLIQASLSYRRIINFLTKSNQKIEMEIPGKQSTAMTAMNNAGSISWNYFWRYYFIAAQKAYADKIVGKQDFIDGIEYAHQAGNTHFEVNTRLALAQTFLQDDNLTEYQNYLSDLGTPPEHVWKIFGPFTVTKGLHQSFWPETIKAEMLFDDENYEFIQLYDLNSITDGYLDLKQAVNSGPNSAVYALIPVYSPSSRTVELRTGPNGPVKIWLNNNLVLCKNSYDPAVLDQYITPVNLNSGMNFLLFKISNRIGELGYYFRLTDENGKGYQDILFGEELQTTALIDVME